MKLAVFTCLFAVSALHFGTIQDPPTKKTQTKKAPATKPQDKKARKLPPVLQPIRSRVERRDLLQKFRSRHRIEGTYRLKSMVSTNTRPVKGGRGYLVIGQRHLSMHLYAPGSSPDQANIQAVFRKFRIVGDKLVMHTLLGHRNKSNGDIGLEPVGHMAQHRFELTGAVLRIYRAKDEYLEFERIE